MEGIGGDQPSEQERREGEAGRVETYRCNECTKITRFARYNDPAFLVVWGVGQRFLSHLPSYRARCTIRVGFY